MSDPEELDEIAFKAEVELKERIESGTMETALDLIDWIDNNIGAGYKRLMRVARKNIRTKT